MRIFTREYISRFTHLLNKIVMYYNQFYNNKKFTIYELY